MGAIRDICSIGDELLLRKGSMKLTLQSVRIHHGWGRVGASSFLSDHRLDR